MPEKIKYACIGAGGIADKKHLNNYSKLTDVEIVAICDTNTEAASTLAAKYNIQHIYDNYQDMLKNHHLDLVSVCIPNLLHATTSIDLLRAGINVHCEKPLALNADEVCRIIHEKNKSGKKLMVALNNRFTSEAAQIKKLVNSGFFGEIYHAKCGWRRNSGIPGIGNGIPIKQFPVVEH